MTDMENSGPGLSKIDPIKLPDHTQPSDYSDVHPNSYDPEFISQISSKMQVPHRIAVDNSDHQNVPSNRGNSDPFTDMMVPDRIVLAVEDDSSSHEKSLSTPTIRLESPDFRIGYMQRSCSDLDPFSCTFFGDNQHIEMRSDLALDLKSDRPVPSESLAYVGLLTPPRTLTMNETFPVVEEQEEKKTMQSIAQGSVGRTMVAGNGHVPAPMPYDPGVNPHDSLLLTEEDETTVLRTQVAKLTRRVQVIEQEHQKRAQRELVLYPVLLGYLLWKVLGWFMRDR